MTKDKGKPARVNGKEVNKMTNRQKEQTARENYRYYKLSSDYTLWDAYTAPSVNKRNAWGYCESLCKEKNGHGLKVVSHNSFVFTAGFEYEENGEKKYMHITPSYDMTCTIE